MKSFPASFFLVIQRKTTDDRVQYVLSDKPSTKLTRAQQMLPLVSVQIELSQDETDTEVPEQSDYSTADAEKRRQIYERAVGEARAQIAKLLADRSQKQKPEPGQAKGRPDKSQEEDATQVKFQGGRWPEDAQWKEIQMPEYRKRRDWFLLQ